MTWYAIKDGQRVVRCVEQSTAPQEAHAVLASFSGMPTGGGPGRELREANGALYWANVDTPAAWAGVRAKRDALLAACDWRVIYAADRGGTQATAWALSPWRTYRQALRDITAQSDPFNISWPTPPAQE